MRIEIYNDEPAKKVLRVKLEQVGDIVRLIAVGGNGLDFNLLELTPSGRLHRYTGVGKDTGLDLDEHGCIKLTEE